MQEAQDRIGAHPVNGAAIPVPSPVSLGDRAIERQADRGVVQIEMQHGFRPPGGYEWVWRLGLIFHATVQEEKFHGFHVLGENFQLYAGKTAGGAVQYRAGEIRPKFGQIIHGLERRAAQVGQPFALLFPLIQGLVGTQFVLDLGVIG